MNLPTIFETCEPREDVLKGTIADADTSENQFIADKVAEAESISARKATLLNPTP